MFRRIPVPHILVLECALDKNTEIKKKYENFDRTKKGFLYGSGFEIDTDSKRHKSLIQIRNDLASTIRIRI